MSTEILPEIQKFIQSRWQPERLRYSPEEISPELLHMKERIEQISSRWNPVEIFTPGSENLKQEKAHFLASFTHGEEYLPHFEYEVASMMDVTESRSQLQVLLNEIRAFKPRNEQERLFRTALYYKIRDDIATCDLVSGIQTKDEKMIKNAFDRKYPPIDPILIQFAELQFEKLVGPRQEESDDENHALLNSEQQELLKNSKFNAAQIKSAFEWILSKYGILRNPGSKTTGFEVRISERATDIDVRDKSDNPMTIFIPATKEVTGDKLLSLMAHEIEAHARQSVNGIELFGIGGGALKIDDETLYEGLAIRYDVSFDKRFYGKETGPIGPWYTLASQKASEGANFYEIFQDQYERQLRVLSQNDNPENTIKAQESAWRTTYRVMRGHVDMSNPEGYAMNKDLAYLRGWLMDKQLRDAGYGGMNEMAIMQTSGLQLIARLKIGVEDIPHRYQDFTKTYCFEVLLPSLLNQRS